METLAEQLEALSLGPEATAHWREFLNRSLSMLTAAEAILRAEWPGLITKINKRKKKGGKLHVPEEPDITIEIGHLLRKAIRGLPIEDPWGVVHVYMEDPRESEAKAGKYSERRDLYIHEPYRKLDLIFEAKRLTGANAAEYTGPEGIGRFTSSDPYSRQPVAGMLAHVLDKDLAAWVAAIEAKAGKSLICEATAVAAECFMRYSIENRTASGLPDVLLIHRLVDYAAVCAKGISAP